MNEDLEKRLEAIEEDYLKIRADLVYLNESVRSVLSMVAHHLHRRHRCFTKREVERWHRENLRDGIEGFLAAFADESPAAAAELRKRLQPVVDYKYRVRKRSPKAS